MKIIIVNYNRRLVDSILSGIRIYLINDNSRQISRFSEYRLQVLITTHMYFERPSSEFPHANFYIKYILLLEHLLPW